MQDQLINKVQEQQKFKDDTTLKRYKEGKTYQDSMGFTKNWPEYERFLSGDQWPPVTPKTANLPRPVFNIIDFIQAHKKAGVLTESIKMCFTTEELPTENNNMLPEQLGQVQQAQTGADKFTKYSEVTWEHIQQDKLNDEVVSSASNIGAGIVHYFWNNEKTGGIANPYIGEIDGEFIDPANCFFGNPQSVNVQKQPWIIITKRESLESIKTIAAENNVPAEYIELLSADQNYVDDLYDTAQHELKGTKKAMVLTEYSKKGGKIFFKKVVGDIIIQPETEANLSLYPIAIMVWKPRKKCIYGIGDTEGLIPNQKSINQTMALMMLSVQQTAWPKILAKPGAIKQQITNEPGEILVDHHLATNSDGIKYLNPGQFNPMALTLVDKFMETTKSLAGANDAAVGEAPGADMAAQAIMLLQKSAGLPLENVKQHFYYYMEDVGRIWEDFYKSYMNTTRSIPYTDEEGKEAMTEFIGTEYQEFPMSLKVDIGPASTFSEYMAQSTLDKLLEMGLISLTIYLKYCTRNALPFKTELLRDYQQEQQMMAQAQMMMGMPPEAGGTGGAMPPMEAMPQGVGGDSSLGIAPVHEPNIENIGTNNGKS